MALCFHAISVNNAMCCYCKSAALNAAEMRAILQHTDICTQAESRNVQRALAADVDVNYIRSHTHTHTRRDVVADVRRAVDAVTSLGRHWQPSAAYADPLLQVIFLLLTLSRSHFLSRLFSLCLTLFIDEGQLVVI